MIKKLIQRFKVKIFLYWYKKSKISIKQTDYMDCKIIVRSSEDVGIFILANIFEKSDIEFLLSELKDGDIFFDIGANIGLFSLALANKNKTIKVHAFEPIPLNAKIFEASLELNYIESVKVNQMCVGQKLGDIEFSIAKDSAYSSIALTQNQSAVKIIKVPITTLDYYFDANSLQRIDIIKMDVEGAEKLVLDGAENIFSNHSIRPRLVLMELYDEFLLKFNSSIEDIINLMNGYGYYSFIYINGKKINFDKNYYNRVCNVYFQII